MFSDCMQSAHVVRGCYQGKMSFRVEKVMPHSDSSPVLGSGEATPRVLCSVLVPSIQEGPAGPEKGNKAGEGSGAQVL